MRARIMVAALLGVALLVGASFAAEEGDHGTLVGVISEKGETWIRVKPDEGESMRLIPRWIGGLPKDGGGFDKAMLKKIAQVKVGQKVSVDWLMQEHLRVTRLEVVKGE